MVFGIRDTVKLLRLTGTNLSRQGLNLSKTAAFRGLTTIERSHATIHRRSKKITVGQRKGILTDSRKEGFLPQGLSKWFRDSI